MARRTSLPSAILLKHSAQAQLKRKSDREFSILSSTGSVPFVRLLDCMSVNVFRGKPCASMQKMAAYDYCAERGEAKEDKSKHGVDEAEKVRADAVRDEANGDG